MKWTKPTSIEAGNHLMNSILLYEKTNKQEYKEWPQN